MDDRHKQLLFRAWRRGFRELDLILGAFAEQRVAEMTDEDLRHFERLLEAPDQEVYAWVTGQATAPEAHRTPLLEQIRTFRPGVGPNHA
jgi:antitoxin CptB